MWVKLHTDDETTVLVNTDNVSIFKNHDGNTVITFVGSGDAYIEVTESLKEIIRTLNSYDDGCYESRRDLE